MPFYSHQVRVVRLALLPSVPLALWQKVVVGGLSCVLLTVATVPPLLAQTGINPGASSPTTGQALPLGGTSAVGSTTNPVSGGLGDLGGLTSSLGGIGSGVEQIQSLAQGYLKQFEGLKSQVEGVVGDYIGALTGDVSGAIKNALGALNLPDPSKLLDGLRSKGQKSAQTQAEEVSPNNISGVLPSILKSNAVASVLADLWGQANFSTEAQKAAKADLEGITQKVQAAGQTVAASSNLSTQSTQIASQSGQLASTAGTQAQQAQKRVSTQDAIKDLNLTAGTLSSQLAGQAGQLASQSGQLSNLTSLGATSVGLQGDASAKLTQVNLGVAATVTQLADMNSQMHGAEQQRIIQENALVGQTAEATAGAFHFIR